MTSLVAPLSLEIGLPSDLRAHRQALPSQFRGGRCTVLSWLFFFSLTWVLSNLTQVFIVYVADTLLMDHPINLLLWLSKKSLRIPGTVRDGFLKKMTDLGSD